MATTETASLARPAAPIARTTATGTRQMRTLARLMMAPAVILLLIWMIVPLAMTLYFSFLNYNLLNPGNVSWAGLFNYRYFYTDPAFWQSIWNTLLLVGGVLMITVIGGIALALLLDQPILGQGIVRILVISPFRIGSCGLLFAPLGL